MQLQRRRTEVRAPHSAHGGPVRSQFRSGAKLLSFPPPRSCPSTRQLRDSPAGRLAENRPSPDAQVAGLPDWVVFTTITSGGRRRSNWAPATPKRQTAGRRDSDNRQPQTPGNCEYRVPECFEDDSLTVRTCVHEAERRLGHLGRWCMNRRVEAIRGPGPVGARWATISA